MTEDVIDMELSKIALGCDSKPFKKGKDVTEILDACRQIGINVFDTARGYGKSEKVLGEYIRTHGNREDYYVISKGCLPYPFSRVNEKCLIKDLEKSLTTLNIGYIDLYLLHRDDSGCNLRLLIQVLNEYIKKGKIKAYGFSNFTAKRVSQAERIAKLYDLVGPIAVSDNLTLLPWVQDPWGGSDGCVSLTGKPDELKFFEERGYPIYSYSPLARGYLTGRVNSADSFDTKNVDKAAIRAYQSEENIERLKTLEGISKELNISIPSLTIAYLCNKKLKIVPVIGSTSPIRLKENMEATKIVLPEETMAALDELSLNK